MTENYIKIEKVSKVYKNGFNYMSEENRLSAKEWLIFYIIGAAIASNFLISQVKVYVIKSKYFKEDCKSRVLEKI